MIVAIVIWMAKLILALLLLKGRIVRTKLWCAVCLLCGSLFEVSEYVRHIGASSAYLTFVYQVLVFLRETGMPYALLMAGVAYADWKRRGLALWLRLLLLIPPVMTAFTLTDGMLRLDNRFFVAWCSSYLLAAIVLMLGNNAFSRAQPSRSRQKTAELFIVISSALALLLFHYLSAIVHGRSASESLPIIATLALLLFAGVILRSGTLDSRLRPPEMERQLASGTMRALHAGTTLLTPPLENRLANIDMLANRIAERTEEAAADVQLIHQETGRLFEMIRRFQHRTGLIELNEQPYSLNELIRAAVEACSAYQSEKKPAIRFRSRVHAVVHCDNAHLQEAVVCLLHNAIDALPSRGGGTVEIRLDRVGRLLQLDIIDNGHGIEAEVAARMRDPLFSTRGGEHHFGLGLTYSAIVVEKHEGTLTIASTAGTGTAATIRLPMRRVAALASVE